MKRLLFLAFGLYVLNLNPTVRAADRWWPSTVDQALARAGTNRVEIEAALNGVSTSQREAMQFLVGNMPECDLQSLSSAYLLENVALAEQALAEAPWRDRVSRELFLNDILPYASVTERRDAWRKELRDRCVALVKDCQTPGEAARRLNERLFPLVKVKYSTQRRRADQGPLETMQSGLASCTGLSILLIDACRSVGVPARLVGTPNWVDKRGNHTWVEVWDGDWHFLGAAEPDPNGLDRGWFTGDASRALRDSRENAIYASSFRPTGLLFPLVWAPRADYVNAVNVTDRYTRKATPPDPAQTRLLVSVRDPVTGKRVAAIVRLLDPETASFLKEGTSRDERFDTNDLLEFSVPRQRAYRIEAQFDGRQAQAPFAGTTEATAVVTLNLETPAAASEAKPAPATKPEAKASAVPAAPKSKLSRGQDQKLRTALAGYFAAPAEKRAAWKFASSLDKLLLKDEAAVRRIAWETYRTAPGRGELRTDFEAHQVRFEQYLSPYTVKTVGHRPEQGGRCSSPCMAAAMPRNK